jgi:putative radical SAM enzyme (TIGR03279 family)
MARSGIRILEVAEGSLGMELGLRAGDEVLSVNGHPIGDELALKFHLADEAVELEIRRPDQAVECFEIDLSEGRDLGIRVEDFRTRTCNNDCVFCFIKQLPPAVRPSLLVKDDDYRLSFLHGNYITLTNLPESELDRIVEQRLSPLYVSVHATEPELRTRVLGRRKADDLDRKMRKLIGGGITLHTQIVLMPEVNDGAHLEKTVFDLFGYHPGVDSVAIVPLGLSDHGTAREALKPVTSEYCRQVIEQVLPWQDHFRMEVGRTFAYLADEFYIQGGNPLPDTQYYDDFAQIEDGIGLVRKFLNEFEAELGRRRRIKSELRGTLATAALFHPFLEACIVRFNDKLGSRISVRMIENRFMGKNITVAGLLAGSDFEAALRGHQPGKFLIIPNEAVSRIDGILLDNMSPAQLSAKIGVPVYPSGRTMKDFFTLLCDKL